MALAPPEPKIGDYVTFRASDTPEQREDARQQLLRNGCKRFRVVNLPDGRISVHGYLRADG